MRNERYFVSRQRYFPDGNLVVEIAEGGLDYSNPDMLTPKFDGEAEEYLDPREALKAAISIAEEWRKITDEPVGIAAGYSLGFTLPFSEMDCQELEAWAEREAAKKVLCDRCREPIEGEFFIDELDNKFCSESCFVHYWEDAESLWMEGEDVMVCAVNEVF